MLADSAGIDEEALKDGTVKLVGTDYNKIVSKVSHLVNIEKNNHIQISQASNLYDDRLSRKRILTFI